MLLSFNSVCDGFSIFISDELIFFIIFSSFVTVLLVHKKLIVVLNFGNGIRMNPIWKN